MDLPLFPYFSSASTFAQHWTLGRGHIHWLLLSGLLLQLYPGLCRAFFSQTYGQTLKRLCQASSSFLCPEKQVPGKCPPSPRHLPAGLPASIKTCAQSLCLQAFSLLSSQSLFSFFLHRKYSFPKKTPQKLTEKYALTLFLRFSFNMA